MTTRKSNFPNQSFVQVECLDSRDPPGTAKEDRNSCTNLSCPDCKGRGSYVLAVPNEDY
jgi:hypothetical protein